jgi:predicted site-specific integrase-resolvase
MVEMSNTQNCNTETPLAYRKKDFCRLIGISPATFYKYVNLGKIRVVKIGGRTLVPAAEAQRLLSGEAA